MSDKVVLEGKKTWNNQTTDTTLAVPRYQADFVVLDIGVESLKKKLWEICLGGHNHNAPHGRAA